MTTETSSMFRGTWISECPATGDVVKVPGPTAEERARGSFTYECPCGDSHEVILEIRG